MTPQEFAATLTATYANVLTSGQKFAAKENGLVVVYGMSDDLMEFDGAIYDELGAYEGTTAYLTSAGLLTNDCDDDRCPHFARLKKQAATIQALWCEPGKDCSWTFKTEIPHATFRVMEDDDLYCIGIVFRLADVQEQSC